MTYNVFSGTLNLTQLTYNLRLDMLVRQLGQWSFLVTAPTIWNSLPTHLRSASISCGQFRDEIQLFTQDYT